MNYADLEGLFKDPAGASLRMMTDALERWQFILLGLVGPTPTPPFAREAEHRDGDLIMVALAYGNPFSESGPLVTVHTSTSEWRLSLGQLLKPGPPSRRGVEPSEETATLVIDSKEMPAKLAADGRSVVIQCNYEEVVVTVVSRDWPRDRLRLETVSDVGPYLAGREELVRRWTSGER